MSALSGCKKTMSFTWIGWPGKDVSEEGSAMAVQCLSGRFPCRTASW